MKKAMIAAVALAGLGLSFAGTASAASYFDPGINQRQRELTIRIERGARDGSLTRNEVRLLRDQMREFNRIEARYRVNGLNRFEQRDLSRRLDLMSARVYAQRHDAQQRRPVRW